MFSLTQESVLGDKSVNRVGFGAMQLTGPYVLGPPDDPAAARAVLREAVDSGVNHIDTSSAYGPDLVNELIAEVLHPYPEDLVIATKVGGVRDSEGGWRRESRPDQIREQVERDLKLLRVERLDLVNMRFGVGTSEPDPVPVAEQIGALADLREEGKLDLIGVSAASNEEIREAMSITPLAEVQNAFSLVNRTGEATVDLCRANEIAFVPFYPLGSAFIGGPQAIAGDPAITVVAEKHGVRNSQIALAWLLAHYERTLIIPGTSSLSHLRENLEVDRIELDSADLATLDQATHLGEPEF